MCTRSGYFSCSSATLPSTSRAYVALALQLLSLMNSSCSLPNSAKPATMKRRQNQSECSHCCLQIGSITRLTRWRAIQWPYYKSMPLQAPSASAPEAPPDQEGLYDRRLFRLIVPCGMPVGVSKANMRMSPISWALQYKCELSQHACGQLS